MKNLILIVLILNQRNSFCQLTYNVDLIQIGIMTYNTDGTRNSALFGNKFKLPKGINYSYFITGIDLSKYDLIINRYDSVTLGRNPSNIKFPTIPGFDLMSNVNLLDKFGLILKESKSQYLENKVNNNQSEIKKIQNKSNNNKVSRKKPKSVNIVLPCDSKVIIKLDSIYNEFNLNREQFYNNYYEFKQKYIQWLYGVSKGMKELYGMQYNYANSESIIDILKNYNNSIFLFSNQIIKIGFELNKFKCQDCVIQACIRDRDSLFRLDLKNSINELMLYNKEISRDSIIGLVELENELKLSKPDEYTSFPIHFEGGESEIVLQLKPKSNFKGPNYGTSIKIVNTHKTYFGYSSGIFYSSNKDCNYSLHQFNDSTKIVYEGKSFHTGINVLVHYGQYFLNSEFYSWQVGIGPSLSLIKPLSPGLMVVGGFGFGKKDKILINLGFHTGFVKRKSMLFSNDRIAGLIDDSTVSKLKTNFVFGINYLFY